jgi:hypothetical protein
MPTMKAEELAEDLFIANAMVLITHEIDSTCWLRQGCWFFRCGKSSLSGPVSGRTLAEHGFGN